MKKIIYSCLSFLLLTIIILLTKQWLIIKIQASEFVPVVINEIMYNPEGADTNHEWVEILNISTSTNYIIDNSWRFNDGSNHLLNLISGTSTLVAGDFAIIAANADIFSQDYPDFSGNLFDSTMSLNNTQDTVALSLDSGQTFFNSITYEADLGGSDNGYTLEKDGQTWRESFALGGTPGKINLTELLDELADEEITEEATSTPPIIETPEDDNETPTTTPPIQEDEVPNVQHNNEVVVLSYSSQLILNEILPDPIGSDTNDEFIELYNQSTLDIDVNGWQLGDASAKLYTINHQDYASTIVPAFGYFIIYSRESKVSLNNSGDSVKLFQPDGNLLEQLDYGKSLTGYAYMKNAGTWLWTETPTPGRINVFYLTSNDEESVDAEVQSLVVADNNLKVNFNPDNYLGLRLNEFLPNPIGADSGEWIELYNNSSSTLNLEGFSLDDGAGGSKSYIFPASTTISAFGYLVINKADSKISLNNDQDEVRLFNPVQEIMDAVSYFKSVEGKSYNYNDLDDEWSWLKNISPAKVNVFKNLNTSDSIVEEIKTIVAEKIYLPYEVASLDKGDKVKLKGVITATLDSVNARAVYVATIDENRKILLDNSLQVYSSNTGLIKNLEQGDVVEFSGYVSESGGIKRLNLNKESLVSIIGKVNLPNLELISTIDINEDFINSLVKVSGQMTEKKGNYFYLDDGNGEIRVILRSFKVTSDEVKEGDYLEVSGIVTQSNGELKLMPRFKDDLVLGRVLGAEESMATSSEEVINLPIEDRKNRVLKYLSAIGETIVNVGLNLLTKLKFHK